VDEKNSKKSFKNFRKSFKCAKKMLEAVSRAGDKVSIPVQVEECFLGFQSFSSTFKTFYGISYFFCSCKPFSEIFKQYFRSFKKKKNELAMGPINIEKI